MTAPHPYLSKASLAAALEISESTVDDMVRRGVLPKPVKLSSGCVRWRWETVDRALASLGAGGNHAGSQTDTQGVERAIQAAKERGRDRAA
jgi:predicted DNA-binding transcriptional regulator AlpA